MADKMFLIYKNGLFYRPESKGYTSFKSEAGRYTLEEVALLFPVSKRDDVGFVAEEDAEDF